MKSLIFIALPPLEIFTTMDDTQNLIESTVLLPRESIGDEDLQRPDWTQSARNTKDILALDKNENTDPVLKRLISKLLAEMPAEAVMEYPECAPYYHLLADHLKVDPNNLLFTPGSDGAIRSVFETFLSSGQRVVQTLPSFAMFPLYTQIYGGITHGVNYERTEHGPALLPTAICERITSLRPRLLCLPNPDSPTGTIFDIDALEHIIATCDKVGTVALIDEAYYPFSKVSALPLINRYKNLVVAQTFAKAWGIAGLRLGFAAAHPDITKLLHKVRPMYEVNGLALAMMSKLIENIDEIKASANRINAGKDAFILRMQGLGFKTFDCAGNFVLVDFDNQKAAVHAALLGKVLYKLSFDEPCLQGFSRFTTAPKETMEQLSRLIEDAL